MSGNKARTGSGSARKASGKKALFATGVSERTGWQQIFESENVSARVLWNKEAGYSAMAVLPDGTIVVLFERGEFDWWGANQSVAVARFNLAWIEKGF